MKNKYALGIIFFLIVGLFFFYLIQKNGDEVQVVDTIHVEMNGEAFVPNEFTVKNYTEVIFTNTSSISVWPASNIHPTHGIYPEFDPQKAIQPGESWSFIFTKVGKWRMHDHLEPTLMGTITVVE